AKEFNITENPLLLAVFFGFFPLRWILYRNVGASEPAFIFFCLSTIYFLKKGRTGYSVISASLATLTRIFGLLLFPVLLVSFYLRGDLNLRNFLLSLAIPASLLGLFSYYRFSLGDFFAYFGINGGYLHEPFFILTVFVNSHFGELYGILVLVYAIAATVLWRRGEREMALFVSLYLPLIVLVAHGDASRYMLPMAPFALMAFEGLFPKHKPVYVALIALAAILSFIYAWTMIPTNLMPEETFRMIIAALGHS
ncbi:MAG TPA: hypothetical protein VE134_09395, partial [Methanomicrobiales archaeon]|nr:hypothetical protein [Methanomicrobiales archaeon]